ncbi:MAG: alginate export family protein, partial [Prosthecobacter sp.]
MTLKQATWLDLGLDYRFRYEYREDDIRRAENGLDDPFLHRTRAYIGIHDALDPFRFAMEMQDARRYHSRYP